MMLFIVQFWNNYNIYLMQRNNLNNIRSQLKNNFFSSKKSHTKQSEESKEQPASAIMKKEKALHPQTPTQSSNTTISFPTSPKKIVVEENHLLFENKYTLLEKIGEGAHGVVKKCMKKGVQSLEEISPTKQRNKNLFAVKVIKTGDPEIINTITQTFHVNRLLNDIPQVIKVFDLFIDERKELTYLIMEYCEYPSLEKLMTKRLHHSTIQKILEMLALTVSQIHLKGVSHRDLKPDNILVHVKENGEVDLKIIDFGVSKQFLVKVKNEQSRTDMWTRTGTILYSAPEIFFGVGYNEKVDIWSLGVIMYQLLCHQLPYHLETNYDTIELIIDPIESIIFNDVFLKLNFLEQDLLRRLLQKDPNRRLTAEEFLLHPWLKSSVATSPVSAKTPQKSQDDSYVKSTRIEFSPMLELAQSTQLTQMRSDNCKQKWSGDQIQEQEEEEEISPKIWENIIDRGNHIHHVHKELRNNFSLRLNQVVASEYEVGSSIEIRKPSDSQTNSEPNESPQINRLSQFTVGENILDVQRSQSFILEKKPSMTKD